MFVNREAPCDRQDKQSHLDSSDIKPPGLVDNGHKNFENDCKQTRSNFDHESTEKPTNMLLENDKNIDNRTERLNDDKNVDDRIDKLDDDKNDEDKDFDDGIDMFVDNKDIDDRNDVLDNNKNIDDKIDVLDDNENIDKIDLLDDDKNIDDESDVLDDNKNIEDKIYVLDVDINIDDRNDVVDDNKDIDDKSDVLDDNNNIEDKIYLLDDDINMDDRNGVLDDNKDIDDKYDVLDDDKNIDDEIDVLDDDINIDDRNDVLDDNKIIDDRIDLLYDDKNIDDRSDVLDDNKNIDDKIDLLDDNKNIDDKIDLLDNNKNYDDKIDVQDDDKNGDDRIDIINDDKDIDDIIDVLDDNKNIHDKIDMLDISKSIHDRNDVLDDNKNIDDRSDVSDDDKNIFDRFDVLKDDKHFNDKIDVLDDNKNIDDRIDMLDDDKIVEDRITMLDDDIKIEDRIDVLHDRTDVLDDYKNVDNSNDVLDDDKDIDIRIDVLDDDKDFDNRIGLLDDHRNIDDRTYVLDDDKSVDDRITKVDDDMNIDDRIDMLDDDINIDDRVDVLDDDKNDDDRIDVKHDKTDVLDDDENIDDRIDVLHDDKNVDDKVDVLDDDKKLDDRINMLDDDLDIDDIIDVLLDGDKNIDDRMDVLDDDKNIDDRNDVTLNVVNDRNVTMNSYIYENDRNLSKNDENEDKYRDVTRIDVNDRNVVIQNENDIDDTVVAMNDGNDGNVDRNCENDVNDRSVATNDENEVADNNVNDENVLVNVSTTAVCSVDIVDMANVVDTNVDVFDVSNFCMRLSPYVVDIDLEISSSDEDDESLCLDSSIDNNDIDNPRNRDQTDTDDDDSFSNVLHTSILDDSENKLKCLSLNVGGIKTKLLHPEFKEFLMKFDIICISESKLADTDDVSIDGYTSFYKNRQRYKKKSGGLLVLVKNTFVTYVTVFEENSYKNKIDTALHERYEFVQHDISRNVLVFQILDPKTGLKTLFCAVYIEPSNSKYFNANAYIDLQNTIGYFDVDNICLLGDFNSRTGNLNDLLEENCYVDHLVDANVSQDIPERTSQDKQTNTMGLELINFCKANDFIMLNGRVGKDKGHGKATCKDASVVDYIIVSSSLFTLTENFTVLDFNEVYSDVHCAVIANFEFNKVNDSNAEQNDSTESNDELFVKWDNDKKRDYVSNLCEEEIMNINESLDILLENCGNVSKDLVNDTVQKINACLLESAKKSDIAKIKRKKYKKRTEVRNFEKPWFDNTCRMKRRQFAKLRKKALKNKQDKRLTEDSKNVGRDYKKHLRKCERIFRANTANRLRELKSKSPTEYHRILNSINGKKHQKMPDLLSFFEMFKNLNNNAETNNESENITINLQNANTYLNDLITEKEVIDCIKKLKNNKACGLDYVLNEFLKVSCDKMISIYTKLFNVVLSTGIVPENWTIGVIKPLYKNKGSSDDPNNYRGITLLSCFGKLFTAILNDRIKLFLENYNLLGPEQTGFRAGFSTLDNLFTLYGIIDILHSKNKRLYCAFLDLEKAFDKIDRVLLWEKLINSGIDGKIVRVIVNLYNDAKSCVMVDGICSDYFKSLVGVRQGENLSPILFALFINDFKDYLNLEMLGLSTIAEEARKMNMSEEEVEQLLKLYVLLYADDSVIISETINGLQKGLTLAKHYCDRNKLKLNAKKCKVVVFSKGKIRNIPKFYIGNEEIEVVSDFLYLGVKLNYNNRFSVAQKDLIDRASRAMFSLLKKSKNLNLPIDLILDLFDSTVVPVLIYGCEIWGHDMIENVTKLQLRFYKFVLKFRQSTPNIMVFGETGKFPIEIEIKSRLLCYWFRLIDNKNLDKFSNLIYKLLLYRHRTGTHINSYLQFVKTTLDNLGLSNLWLAQENLTCNLTWFKEKIKRSLKDQYIQFWYSHVDNDDVCLNYRMFKDTFGQDRYLKIIPDNYIITLARFRTTNNYAPVNRLRFTRTIRIDRICQKCHTNEIGDEFHFLFVCHFFSDKRKEMLPTYATSRPNAVKYRNLMSTDDKHVLLNLARFVSLIEKELKSSN